MKLRTLLEEYKNCMDYEIVLSKHFVIDVKEGIEGIVDAPVIGLAFNDETKELRFVIEPGHDLFGPVKPISEL